MCKVNINMNLQLMHFGIYIYIDIYIYIQMYVSLSISLSCKSVITSFYQRRPASLSNTINQFFIILRSTLSSERLTAASQMSKQLIIHLIILVFQHCLSRSAVMQRIVIQCRLQYIYNYYIIQNRVPSREGEL